MWYWMSSREASSGRRSRMRSTSSLAAFIGKAYLKPDTAGRSCDAESALLPDVHQELPRAGAPPVLPDVEALPGAEAELAVDDGDGEGDVGERGLDVGGHVVRTLRRVGVEGIALRHQPVEPALQILPRRGIGILLDRQARGR